MSKASLNDRLADAIDEMVEKGIYWSEAAAQFEKLFIVRALRESDGNLSRAAGILGVHRNTLSKKIREYEIRRKGGNSD